MPSPYLDRPRRELFQAKQDRASYRRADFSPGPCYLPPDEIARPLRWYWWRDPIVIVSAGLFFFIGLCLIALAAA
jgi:hypothetical protein